MYAQCSRNVLKGANNSIPYQLPVTGENIAPVPIEEAIRAELEEMVSQVMVVGDRRKHLAVLLTLRSDRTTHE